MTTSTLPAPQTASRFNPWNELAGVGVAVIEASWMVLLFQSLNETTASASTALVFVYFVIVFWAAYMMVRGFMQVRLVQNAARLVLLATYGIFVWLGIRVLLPPEAPSAFDPFTTSLRGIGEITRLVPAWFWLIPVLLWLFLRGSSAARQGVGTFSVQRHFKLGVAMFLGYSLLAFASTRELPGLGIFVVFLFATLLAMASARVSILGRLRGGRRNPFSRGWFGALAAAVTLTVGTAFTFGMLTTGRFLLFYRQVVSGLLLAAITVTLAPFLFILGLFANTPINPLPAPPPTPALPPWEQDGQFFDFAEATSEQVEIIPAEYRGLYYAAAVILGILIVVSLFFGIRTMSRRRESVEMTEYLYREGDLLSALRREFERRRQQLRENWFGANPLARGQQILAAARIRRIYGELMDLAESFGAPRDPAQTPLEFSAALEQILPETQAELASITNAYLKIRYGELPEHAEEVRIVEDAWAQVQAAGNARVKAYEQKLKAEERERKRKEQIQ